MPRDTQGLGVLSPDSARTILVISADGELAVALRERVDGVLALIRDIRLHETAKAYAACLPWPWMVVGAIPEIPGHVQELLRSRPTLIFWWGSAPPRLPGHARRFERFGELATAISVALSMRVAGMRMAVGLGVDLPDGGYVRSAELQALVSAHPRSFDIPLESFRSASRTLSRHRISLRAARNPTTGEVELVELRGGSSG